MRLYLFLLSFSISFSALAQPADTVKSTSKPKPKPIDSPLATINNLGFKKKIYISKDSLHNGFKVTLSDSSYKIVGFNVVYFGRHCDAYLKDILGAEANELNLPILKRLYAEDKIFIECIAIARGKEQFTARGFLILVTQ